MSLLEPQAARASRQWIRRYGMLLVLLAMMLLASLLSDRFLTPANLMNVTRQVAINAILAAGMTVVILSGGIDLSVGSVLALTGAVGAGMMAAGAHWLAAVLVMLGLGTLLGVVNGFFVAYGQLPPFIVTLAMMAFARGSTLVYTNGRPITVLNNAFQWFGHGSLGVVPAPVVIMVVVYVAFYVFLTRATLGRLIYAVGGNERAARMSGVRVNFIKVLVYALSGFTSGLAGIVLTSRLFSAQPTAGVSYELDAIAAVILGGTSLAGGRGSVTGTIIGAFIIGILGNVLNLLNVSSFYQDVAKGVVILVAVLLDRLIHAGGQSALRKGVAPRTQQA